MSCIACVAAHSDPILLYNHICQNKGLGPNLGLSSTPAHHAHFLPADERTEVSRAHSTDPLSAVTLSAPMGNLLRLPQSPAGPGDYPKDTFKNRQRGPKIIYCCPRKQILKLTVDCPIAFYTRVFHWCNYECELALGSDAKGL